MYSEIMFAGIDRLILKFIKKYKRLRMVKQSSWRTHTYQNLIQSYNSQNSVIMA